MTLTFSANQLRVIATMLPCDLGEPRSPNTPKGRIQLETYGLHKHFSNVIFLQFPMEFAPVTFPPPRILRALPLEYYELVLRTHTKKAFFKYLFVVSTKRIRVSSHLFPFEALRSTENSISNFAGSSARATNAERRADRRLHSPHRDRSPKASKERQ